MNKQAIQDRINALQVEQFELNKAHELAVAQHQEYTNQFQQQVAKNQVRFQQLAGAISELQLLLTDEDKPPGKKTSLQGPDRKEALNPALTRK